MLSLFMRPFIPEVFKLSFVERVRRKLRSRLNNWYISYTDPQYFIVQLRLFKRRAQAKPEQRHLFLTNILLWKRRMIAEYFLNNHDYVVHFIENTASKAKVMRAFQSIEDPIIVSWGYGSNEHVLNAAKTRQWEMWRLEDGFIRSVGLGIKYAPPVSFILDKTGGLYFDARSPSHIENTLNNEEITEDQRREACLAIETVVSQNITKYNLKQSNGGALQLPAKPRILVFGQFEGDASLKYGSTALQLNSELIDLALKENPQASIIYRPHPDVASGLRPAKSEIAPYLDRIDLLPSDFPVWSHLDEFEKVYVMTSLAGFEAALRGATVRVAGSPFYAGWGITEDLQEHPRRKKKRSIEEVFHAAYLQGAIYVEPGTGRTASFESTLKRLQGMKN